MKSHAFVLITMLCGMLLVAPALAAIYEPTWKGIVTAVDPEASTISVEITGIYGCQYIEGETNCAFDAIDAEQITANVRSRSIYDSIEVGDSVIGKSLGSLKSTTWTAFAILIEGDMYIKTFVGDNGLLDIIPLAADYPGLYRDYTVSFFDREIRISYNPDNKL